MPNAKRLSRPPRPPVPFCLLSSPLFNSPLLSPPPSETRTENPTKNADDQGKSSSFCSEKNGLFFSFKEAKRERKTNLFCSLFRLPLSLSFSLFFDQKQVAKLVHDQELSVEERNLLSVAFKNVIGAFFRVSLIFLEVLWGGRERKRTTSRSKKLTFFPPFSKTLKTKNHAGARRASWRIVSSIEQKEEAKNNEAHVARIKTYRAVVSFSRKEELKKKISRGAFFFPSFLKFSVFFFSVLFVFFFPLAFLLPLPLPPPRNLSPRSRRSLPTSAPPSWPSSTTTSCPRPPRGSQRSSTSR